MEPLFGGLGMAQGAVVQVPSALDALVVAATFPRCAPQALFDYWIAPELLPLWWPPVATIDPRAGGAYHFAWPSMGWHLRGTYRAFSPAARLDFSWRWDHDPADQPTREVALVFAPHGAQGTRLTVTHGRYTLSPADRDERRGHLEGWTAFLTMLHQTVASREELADA